MGYIVHKKSSLIKSIVSYIDMHVNRIIGSGIVSIRIHRNGDILYVLGSDLGMTSYPIISNKCFISTLFKLVDVGVSVFPSDRFVIDVSVRDMVIINFVLEDDISLANSVCSKINVRISEALNVLRINPFDTYVFSYADDCFTNICSRVISKKYSNIRVSVIDGICRCWLDSIHIGRG